MVLQGRVTHTFVRGQPVFADPLIVGEPGTGQFVAPRGA